MRFPTKVAQTSALPAGLSLARKPRFWQLLAEGQGVELFAPAVAGKSKEALPLIYALPAASAAIPAMTS